jgi:coenzyme F420-0:L-glutamate ligase/coenzyme F420-1:gamma-L-glutamate ligase
MPRSESGLQLFGLRGFPRIAEGDDLAAQTVAALQGEGLGLRDGDVLVYAQKIVSKAEGRLIDLATVTPGPRALALAAVAAKDPRLVELVLRESSRVVRVARDVLIVEHRLGCIMANAGIDQSNVAESGRGEFALLLPQDPDSSAERIHTRLHARTGLRTGIVISDSFGRPWRVGTVGVAIGCAGIAATWDLRGQPDLYGRRLKTTVVGHADEIAAAASLVMGQGGEGIPAVLLRGLPPAGMHQPARALVRPSAEDLFR